MSRVSCYTRRMAVDYELPAPVAALVAAIPGDLPPAERFRYLTDVGRDVDVTLRGLRADALRELRDAGETPRSNQSIANELGLSRQRVAQLLG